MKGGMEMEKRAPKRITAGDIMTADPVTATATTTVRDAIRILHSLEVRHLPILGARGELVGIVADRDLRDVTVAYTLVESPARAIDWGLDEPVTKLMSIDPVTITADAGIDQVIDVLIATKVGALPVVEPRSRDLLGIISYIDVLRALRSHE